MNDSNILVGVLFLKKASDLLDNDEPAVSLTLLKLAKAILETHKISQESLSEAEKLSLEIANQPKNNISNNISNNILNEISSDKSILNTAANLSNGQ